MNVHIKKFINCTAIAAPYSLGGGARDLYIGGPVKSCPQVYIYVVWIREVLLSVTTLDRNRDRAC